MKKPDLTKIAVLVDLPAGKQAGGHVKMWEHLAAAAAQSRLPLDLTVYLSGTPTTTDLADHVRLLQVPPVFSTARLKFMPYLPDHTDLAAYHHQLARHLDYFDIVHTTDAFFAFARTAEKLRPRRRFALVHSFHTDQPAYATLFTARSIRAWLGNGRASKLLIDTLKIPQWQGWNMRRQQRRHIRACDYVLTTRPEDRAVAAAHLDPAQIGRLRLGADRTMFYPDSAQRQALCARYGIAPDELIILFVGRLDEGKNIYPLAQACATLRAAGYKPHLLAAGVGPAAADIQRMLPGHATLCGFVPPAELAKLYAGAHVLAIPSEIEIGSLVLIEALASGLPVMVSAASQLAQLHGPNAALQPVASGAAGWTEALLHLMTSPTQLPTMQAAAYDTSQKKIADWNMILREDLFPAWQQALRRRG